MNIPNSIDALDENLDHTSGFDEGLQISTKEHSHNQTKLLYESHLIQWIISQYSRTKKSFHIEFDLSNSNTSQSLSQTIIGRVLALLNNEKIDGFSRHDTEKFKIAFFESQKSWPDLDVSESAKLFCLDTRPGLSSDSPPGGLAQQLYQKGLNHDVVDVDAFIPLVNQLTDAVVISSSIKGKIVEKKEKLALIIYELFKNTHDHARHSLSGANINSLRGIYSRFYSLASINSQLKTASPNYVEQYVQLFVREFEKRKNQEPSPPEFFGFLELSVFDSGPGLAAKWLGTDKFPPNPAIQYEALVSCLTKGASTSGNNERGYGLWKVLEELKQLKGLIAVRSNNLHAATQFRTFRHPIKTSKRLSGREIPQETLYDWHRGTSIIQRGYPGIQGTLISILVPVGEI